MKRVRLDEPKANAGTTITFISNGTAKAVIVMSNKLNEDYNNPLN